MSAAPRVPARAKVWLDGAVVDGEAAQVSVFDRGFLYGDSVYEVTRTARGAPLFWEEHLSRLCRSAAGLSMAPPDLDLVRSAAAACLAALGEEAYLRVVLTRGAGDIGLDPACADAPRLVVIAKPLRLPEPRLYSEGAALVTVPQRRNAEGAVPAEVKSGNYLPSVLAMEEVRRRGAYEAVLCDGRGHVSEGASSNLYFVSKGCVRTPPGGVLLGVTRQVVLAMLRARGVPCEEAEVTLEEAAAADEAFLSSAVRGVMPIASLDGAPIGDGRPGPLTRAVMAWYGERIGEAPPGLDDDGARP